MSDDVTNTPLQQLLNVLQLEPSTESTRSSDDAVLVGDSLHQPTGRVYGGQVLAQSLLAAGSTIDSDRLPHSVHGYFLRAGDVRLPITFGVERLRDGRSFSARRTHAYQNGEPILSMISSFQVTQPGIDFSDEMPEVQGPDDLPSAFDLLSGIDHPMAKFWSTQSAFDIRHVDGAVYLAPSKNPLPYQAVWMRARGPVVGGQMLQRAVLAYACDQIMLEPILRASGNSWVSPGLSLASLDHAMWWHRDVQVDDWLLYVQSAPSAQGGRGLGAARVFNREGHLVATIAQEGMVRVPA